MGGGRRSSGKYYNESDQKVLEVEVVAMAACEGDKKEVGRLVPFGEREMGELKGNKALISTRCVMIVKG